MSSRVSANKCLRMRIRLIIFVHLSWAKHSYRWTVIMSLNIWIRKFGGSFEGGGWGGRRLVRLVGKAWTMIAASKRGLHRFILSSCTYHYRIMKATSTYSIEGRSLQNSSTTLVHVQNINKKGNKGGHVHVRSATLRFITCLDRSV